MTNNRMPSMEARRGILLTRYLNLRHAEMVVERADQAYREYLTALRTLDTDFTALLDEVPPEVADDIRRSLNGLAINDWVQEQAAAFEGFPRG